MTQVIVCFSYNAPLISSRVVQIREYAAFLLAQNCFAVFVQELTLKLRNSNVRRKNVLRVFVIAISFLIVSPGFAEDATKPTQTEAAKNLDPGRPKTRLFVRTEFKESESGDKTTVIDPLYDFPIGQRFSVRLQTPFVNKDFVEGGSEGGNGDITARFSYKATTTDAGNSLFLSLETKWDTASDAELGGGKNLVAPTVFGFVKIPSLGLFSFPLFQTFFTVGGDDSRDDVSFSALKLPAMKKLSHGYYLFFEPVVLWDHERGEQSTGNFELEFGRFVKPSMMLYARPGTTLWGDNTSFSFKYNFEVGFRLFM
jgi:hypothetical protein